MTTPDDDRSLAQLTAADLAKLVRDEVDRAVKAAIEAPPSEHWMDIPTAAKHFKCSSKTIYLWIGKGAPYEAVGSTTRVSLTQFSAWVSMGSRTAAQPDANDDRNEPTPEDYAAAEARARRKGFANAREASQWNQQHQRDLRQARKERKERGE
jgi:hypothetical protein